MRNVMLLRRGFGFVTYLDQTGVDKVLAQNRHELDSKTVSFFIIIIIILYISDLFVWHLCAYNCALFRKK